jgi:DNA topoisomerase-1
MVIKMGRYGRFVACSGYPECKNTKPLLVKIGVACPKCGSELVVRQNRKKRTFYGCSGYPECDFTTGGRPLSQPCPECGGLLVMRGKTMVRCIKCDFSSRADRVDREALTV